jgi:hypothetical protein
MVTNMERSLAEFFGHTASAAGAAEVARTIARAMNTDFLKFMDLPPGVAAGLQVNGSTPILRDS